MTRPKTELVLVYLEQQKKQLYDPASSISDTVHVSLISELTLSEYITAQSNHCFSARVQPCTKCSRMLQVATTIHIEGYYTCSDAHTIVSPMCGTHFSMPGERYFRCHLHVFELISNQVPQSAFLWSTILL